ncbi:MAG: efflux RND transporter periplasmic adaptor subunit [Vicinamibacterales bacterium]
MHRTADSLNGRPRRAVARAAGVIGAIALGTLACGPGAHDTPDQMVAPAAQALPVVAAAVEELPVRFEAGGIVRARSTATLAARLMAPVLTVTVKPGDLVTRGTTLITLDAREMAAQAARGKASAAAAEEAARAAEAQVAAAEASVRLARATHDRISGLHAKQSATPHELDQAVAALRAAEAQVAAAQSQRGAAAAARDAARAGADAADVGLSYTTITAPFDGRVATRSVDPGTLATPGMPLLVLEQTGAARLEVTLDEARAGQISAGQTGDVRLEGPDAGWIPATVAEVGRVDPASHSFLVKLDLPQDAAARSGTFGRARFPGAARRALTVPATSVVRRGQLAFVFIVGSDRLARLRPVTPGPTVDGRVEILAGLVQGDTVVTTPTAGLRDGTPISGLTADGGERPGAGR